MIRYTADAKVDRKVLLRDFVSADITTLLDALDEANADRARMRAALRGLFAAKANCAYSVKATKAERAARPAAWVAAYAALDGIEVRGAAAPPDSQPVSNPE